MEKFNFLEFIINALLASFGGLVRRLAEMENKKSDPRKMSLFYYIVGCAISMFVGVVIYLLCKNFGVSQYLTAGLTSLGGYMGVPILDLLSNIAVKKVKDAAGYQDEIKSENNEDEEDTNKKKTTTKKTNKKSK